MHGLGRVILGKRLALASMTTGTFARQEAERTTAGMFKLTVRLHTHTQ